MIPPGVYYVTVRNHAKHFACLTAHEQTLTMMFHHDPSSEPCAACGQPLDQPAGPPRCRCDQPTCPDCHPVLSRAIAGNLTGFEHGVPYLYPPGASMPDTPPEDVDIPGFGTFLAVVGAIIGIITITVIVTQEWGYRGLALWVALVLIVLVLALGEVD